jgi:hypothetical protein
MNGLAAPVGFATQSSALIQLVAGQGRIPSRVEEYFSQRLVFLRPLRPSRSRCLLCSLGSLRRRHGLRGIGPTLPSATRWAIFDHDKPRVGMNRATSRHSRLRYQTRGLAA